MPVARAQRRWSMGRACDALRGRWRRSSRLRWSVRIGLAVVVLATAWRLTTDWRLPDVGDPFDVEAAGTVPVRDEDNAYVAYRAASAKLVPYPSKTYVDWKRGVDWSSGWAGVTPALRAWLEENRPALALWREGTTRPEALYHQPKDMRFDTLLSVTQDTRMFANLARLEALRLVSEGNPEGALGWSMAMLRSARHVAMHGGLMERLVGTAIREEAADSLALWAEDERVDARLLRRALGELLAEDARTPPFSRALEVEYLWQMKAIARPGPLMRELPGQGQHEWYEYQPIYQRAQVALGNDRVRSRRVLRLLYANWLWQCDEPPSRRAELASREPPIFRADASAPPAARRLSPGALADQYRGTTLAPLLIAPDIDQRWDREWAARARPIVKLAWELYRRERGEAPKSPRDLVGPYLKVLPEGYDGLADDEATQP